MSIQAETEASWRAGFWRGARGGQTPGGLRAARHGVIGPIARRIHSARLGWAGERNRNQYKT